MMTETPPASNFVRDFKIGNTRIRIADDYCREKSPEDVKRILKEIARNAQESLIAAAMAKASE